MKSKKLLFEALSEIKDDHRFVSMGLNHPAIENETYGKLSCIYITHETQEERFSVEKELKSQGFKVLSYQMNGISEIQVSFFRGRNWRV